MITFFKRSYLFRKTYPAFIHGLIDAVGFYLFRGGRGRPLPSDVKRILVSRIDHLGDVFIAFSVLPHIKKAFPKAEIDFLAGSWANRLLSANPLVARHIAHDSFKLSRVNAGVLARAVKSFSSFTGNVKELRKSRYDICLDLRTFSSNSILLLFLGAGKFNAGFATGGWGFLLDRIIPYKDGVHEVSHMADALGALGIKTDAKKLRPEFPLRNTDLKEASVFLKQYAVSFDEPFALIHIASGLSAKLWRNDRWQELINILPERYGLKPVVCGAEESALTHCINLPALLKLNVFASLAKQASLFIGLDSFPAHLSASFGTPTAVIWCGVNDPVRWKPLGENTVVIRKGVDCSPCFLKDGCKTMKCMDISADDCVKEIDGLIKNTRRLKGR
jgi:ADP-heptose:LPS heptosyltransferase